MQEAEYLIQHADYFEPTDEGYKAYFDGRPMMFKVLPDGRLEIVPDD